MATYLMFILLLSIVSAHFLLLDVENFTNLSIHPWFRSALFALWFGFIISLMAAYLIDRPTQVYLVDFSCYKPEPAQKITRELFMRLSAKSGLFSEQSLSFQKKLLERSGYGEMTYAPKGLLQTPPIISLPEGRRETEMVMFGAIDELLAKTEVKTEDIKILVVNCSLFNPVPSLSAAVVNHYRLRDDILSYNLGGMGCSAGLISIDFTKHLLQVHRNSYALVVSTENITNNCYFGNDRSMLVTNCLFRVGGAAILLSNRSCDRPRSKYQLLLTLRINKSADDRCYNCIVQQEDQAQNVGVSLSKDLTAVAGEALKANITTLGSLVLPLSEQLLYLSNFIARRVFKIKAQTYVPDFKLAFEHFCLHAGGRGVLDELEKKLNLTEWHMEPSRMTLYRFGNTSSSSLWYELAYSEAKGRIKKGNRVWQIGFGSGFKCNSAVWRATRTINPAQEMNPWTDEIDEFPVHVPKMHPLIY